MKRNIIVVLIAALVSLVSIGCSTDSINPISTTPVVGEATALVTVNLAPLGSLGKRSAYSPTPTKIVVGVNPSIKAVPGVDSFTISGTGPQLISLPGFERGKSYTLWVSARNDDYPYELNIGSASVLVPDSPEFQVAMTLGAVASNIKANVAIAGTPVATIANGVSVVWKSLDLGTAAEYKDSSDTSFAPGTIDTFRVQSVMPLHSSPSDGLTTYTIEVAIYCSDGGYYKGSGNIDIAASLSQSVTIPLVKYGGSSSLAKMTITLDPLGNLNVSVQFP
jgi:hypothetical protein